MIIRRYSINKLDEEKLFSLSLGVRLCIDDSCDEIPLLDDIFAPIPLCNTNVTGVQLPGDGSIHGFVKEVGENVGSAAVDIVISRLGLTVCALFCHYSNCNVNINGINSANNYDRHRNGEVY